MPRAWLITLALWSAPALALAAGDDSHGGPLHASDIFSDTNFWWSVINFGVLIWIFRKFGRRPVADYLKSRREEVQRGIEEAAALKRQAQAKYDEYSKRLETLDQELAKLRSDIEKAAEEDKKRIVAEAEDNARRLKQETEALIERQAEQLQRQVTREVVEAAVAAAEQAVREAIRPDDQQRLADDFAAKVKETRS